MGICRLGIATAVLVASNSVGAETLAADSLACEELQTLEFAVQEQIGRRGGVEALRQARLHAEFYAISANAERVKGDLIAFESRVGSPRAGTVAAAQQSALAKAQAFARVANTCAALGQQPAALRELKPISGMAKVQTSVQGAPAELWVLRTSLQP